MIRFSPPTAERVATPKTPDKAAAIPTAEARSQSELLGDIPESSEAPEERATKPAKTKRTVKPKSKIEDKGLLLDLDA